MMIGDFLAATKNDIAQDNRKLVKTISCCRESYQQKYLLGWISPDYGNYNGCEERADKLFCNINR